MPALTALLVTRDEVLLEDMLRLAAAAGVTLDVAHDSAAALPGWGSAPVVLVGSDLLPAVAAQQPVRRDEVHVVCSGPVRDQLFRDALAIGAHHVVELPAAETWLVELLTDIADGGADRALTLGVVGGAGGVGATTFAAALALTAVTERGSGMLVDADPLGGGIDRVVGLEAQDGVRWDSLVQATGRFSSRSLRDSLPSKDGLAVLTWSSGARPPADARAAREVLSAAQRGCSTVVVDLPRHLDPVGTDLLCRCDHVLLVSGLGLPAVAAAGQVARVVRDTARPLHLVTRGKGPGLAPDEVADALGVPLVASVGHQRRLAESVDLGLGPVHSRRSPLARAARAVLERIPRPTARAA